MAQDQFVARLQRRRSILRGLVEVLRAKRIGRQQTIGADMPRRGIAEAARVIEHRDPDHLAIQRTVVGAPLGTRPPGIFVRLALTGQDMPTHLAIHGHQGRNAHTETGIFRVIENYRLANSLERDVTVDDALVAIDLKSVATLILHEFLAVNIVVIIRRDQQDLVVLHFYLLELPMLRLAETFRTFLHRRALGFIESALLMPGLDPAHILVSKPDTAVMRVVMLLSIDCLHRISARDRLARWPDDWPEVRLVGLALDDVFREQFTLIFDRISIITLFEGEPFGFVRCQQGQRHAGQKEKRGSPTGKLREIDTHVYEIIDTAQSLFRHAEIVGLRWVY